MLKSNQDVFQILSEAISEGVIIVDKNQVIVALNSATEHMFGYEKGELLNKPLDNLIPEHFHKKHRVYYKEFFKKGEKRAMGMDRILYGVKKDGSVFPIEVGLNPMIVKDEAFVMALVIDISKRVEIEKNLQIRSRDLQEQVDEQTKELKVALKNEIELNELKTKFLSLVSHEFKTPLSGILTSAMLLKKYTLQEQQDKRDKHIDTITNIVNNLNNILNDFLSVENLESGKVTYHFKIFKLSKVLNEVIYNSNMLLKDGQKIKYPENIDDLSLHQDEKILELTLSNIIHNAIKYSPENGRIDIEISQNKHQTVFKVKDQGVGIPETDQKNIFNRYFRAENVLTIQGTGIGLNIVKNHIENLGGSITFTSQEHIGTTFIITIPNKPNNEVAMLNL